MPASAVATVHSSSASQSNLPPFPSRTSVRRPRIQLRDARHDVGRECVNTDRRSDLGKTDCLEQFDLYRAGGSWSIERHSFMFAPLGKASGSKEIRHASC